MENNYKSYREFIKIMNKLTNEEKFVYLYNYFINNVTYNYFEWLYGFLGYGISGIKPNFIDYKGDLSKKDANIVLCVVDDIERYQTNNDELIVLEEIIKLRKKHILNNHSSINHYKNQVAILMDELFFKQIQDKELYSKLFKIFKEDILDKSFVPEIYADYYMMYDISYLIYKSFWDNYLNGDPEYKKGLIKKGVCRHYSEFINNVLNDLNIKSIDVMGKSNLFHSWNMILVDDDIKFIDITREIYLRDKLNDYNFNKGDWYLIDIEEMFKLEPNRDIREINNEKLETIITKYNYKENMNVIYNALNKNIKLKKKNIKFF